MRTLKQQYGASMTGWIVIICMVGVLGTAALKLMPHYMEYYTIANVLDEMQTNNSLKGKNKKQIINYFYKRMTVNGVRSIRGDSLKVSKIRDTKKYVVEVNYEVRENLFSNIAIVAMFSRTAEVGGE